MNWGFIGYGRIARKFEQNLLYTKDRLVAIASRSGYKNVGEGIRGYENYEDLFNDQEVDIVYVSTTHNQHAPLSIAAMEAGKHVLCEKPLAISAEEVMQMTEVARKNGVLLMEAIWSRFLPGYEKALSLIREGVIGDVQFISAHFGFRMNPDDPKERLITLLYRVDNDIKRQ